jgi:hypothetical protein
MEDDIVLTGIACYGFLAMAGAVQIYRKERRSIWCKPWIVSLPDSTSLLLSRLYTQVNLTHEH